jgi:hypothetical protein
MATYWIQLQSKLLRRPLVRFRKPLRCLNPAYCQILLLLHNPRLLYRHQPTHQQKRLCYQAKHLVVNKGHLPIPALGKGHLHLHRQCSRGRTVRSRDTLLTPRRILTTMELGSMVLASSRRQRWPTLGRRNGGSKSTSGKRERLVKLELDAANEDDEVLEALLLGNRQSKERCQPNRPRRAEGL